MNCFEYAKVHDTVEYRVGGTLFACGHELPASSAAGVS